MKLITTPTKGKEQSDLWSPRPTHWSPLVISTSRLLPEEVFESWSISMGASLPPGPYHERHAGDATYESLRKDSPADVYGYRNR